MKTIAAGRAGGGRPGGFTLIEIGIVIMIIGLLTSFILVVSMQGIERAKERATQSLVAKLDTMVQDRLQVLLSHQVYANLTHRYLADPFYESRLATWVNNGSVGVMPLPAPSARADVIARSDYIKAEMPDVFFIQSIPTGPSNAYPFNFTGFYPEMLGAPNPLLYKQDPVSKYILPLGNGVTFNPLGTPACYGAYPGSVAANYAFTGTGIYGASYSAASGLLKNLGTGFQILTGVAPAPYKPAGYNGVDDDGDGWVDEFDEGVDSNNFAAVQKSLQLHNHATARAESLYAFLVESPGALVGRDQFKDSEVADTDGDGMPEFIDAWGKPLLFFRWPTYYYSDIQRGVAWDGASDFQGASSASVLPYLGGVAQQRDVNPIDPGNQLLSPVWWSGMSLQGAVSRSPGTKAYAFQQMFFSLVDPNAAASSSTPEPNQFMRWDRSGYFRRRAFFNRFLIMSAGPDGEFGVPLMTDNDPNEHQNSSASRFGSQRYTQADLLTNDLVLIENQARPFAMNWNNGSYSVDGGGTFDLLRPVPGTEPPPSPTELRRPTLDNPLRTGIITSGFDDVTNHNLRITGAAAR